MRLLRLISILFIIGLVALTAVMIFARPAEVRAEWLAYVSWEGGQPDIYTENIYTGQKTQVTEVGGYISFIEWSPNGRFILYVHEPGTDWQLKYVDVVTGRTSTLLKNLFPVNGITWSGNKIAFSTLTDDDIISILDLSSGSLSDMPTQNSGDVYPFFTPNGMLFAAIRQDRHHFGLYSIDGDITIEAEYDYFGPSLSPDGKWILAWRYLDQIYQVVKINIDTGEEVLVDVPQKNSILAHWSPDGRWIAYGGSDDSATNIYLTDGDQVKQITKSQWWEGFSAWMPVVDLDWHTERLSGVVLLLVGLQLLVRPVRQLPGQSSRL